MKARAPAIASEPIPAPQVASDNLLTLWKLLAAANAREGIATTVISAEYHAVLDELLAARATIAAQAQEIRAASETIARQVREYAQARDEMRATFAAALTAQREAEAKDAGRYKVVREFVTPRYLSNGLGIKWADLTPGQDIAEKIDELCDAALSTTATKRGETK